MVRTDNKLNRFAFTIIELIFAIVIIGITVVSLPMMSLATSKGVEESIVQEAIFAASAELMGASAGYWDLNSMQDNNFSDISRVIDVNPGTATACVNDNGPRHRLRPGHIAQPKHRRCVDSSAGVVADTNSTAFPNLNNAAHTHEVIFVNPTNGDPAGYKANYTSTITVNTAGDIKTITTTISNTATPPETIVELRMHSANIGEVDYYSKRLF